MPKEKKKRKEYYIFIKLDTITMTFDSIDPRKICET